MSQQVHYLVRCAIMRVVLWLPKLLFAMKCLPSKAEEEYFAKTKLSHFCLNLLHSIILCFSFSVPPRQQIYLIPSVLAHFPSVANDWARVRVTSNPRPASSSSFTGDTSGHSHASWGAECVYTVSWVWPGSFSQLGKPWDTSPGSLDEAPWPYVEANGADYSQRGSTASSSGA